MRDGEIWKAILRLKVFTPWMLLKELNPPPYMRTYAKEKIRRFLAHQVADGILTILNDNPPVFGFPGESMEKAQRTCPICKKKFIPNQSKDTYCSNKCEREYRKRFLEKRRRQSGMREKRRYTPEEEQLIFETLSQHGCKFAILQELAGRLGRTPEAVKSKYKALRRKKHGQKAIA